MGFRRVPRDALLSADMHLAVTDLEPEASPPLEGCGLLDLWEPEKPAVEGARFRDRVRGNR
jgi:hypothetical protein